MFHIPPKKERKMNKSKLRLNVLVLVLLIALVITSVVSAAPKDGPTVKLSVAQGDFDSTQDVLVSVTISNPTKHTVRVLKWFTPVEGVEEPLFFILRDGEPVSYIGAIYKRPAATGRDYISLKAGESITSVVNLGEYYDLSVSGQYEVSYAVTTYNLFNEKGNAFKVRDVLTSDPITFKSNGRPTKRPTPTPTPPPSGLNTFNACTTDQQTIIASARDKATTYSEDSLSYLNAKKTGDRYTTWFGVYDLTRYNTVTTHFDAITSAFNNVTINFDCKCKQPYYAYVYPNQPYNIYLCKVFWQAPPAGTDSQAGTLIHEMSHFDVVASTDDFVYGQTGAMNLAITNPNDAVNNADNHEYFAENTPYQD